MSLVNHLLLALDLVKRGLYVESYRLIKNALFTYLNFLQLHSIFISLSHDCNADCVHCYEKFSNNNYQEFLSTKTVKNIIDQFYDLGGCKIYFCSGEVSLRHDLPELIKYARSKHMVTSITSNGILLNDEKLHELKKAGLNNVIISIDSVDPKKHDELRGVPGCFEKAADALRLADKMNFRTKIWTYLSSTRKDELFRMINFAKNLNVQEIFVFFPLLSGHLYDKPEANLTFQQREEFRKFFKGKTPVNLEFWKETDLCAGGGNRHLNIMPSGEVTFCPPVPYSYGNIHKKSLKSCLLAIKKDFQKFCLKKCTGQCPVNFLEYRENCNATFIYGKN